MFCLCEISLQIKFEDLQVLSSETHPLHFIEEEIHRYTTLSYRAPEMIDIYAGRPIG